MSNAVLEDKQSWHQQISLYAPEKLAYASALLQVCLYSNFKSEFAKRVDPAEQERCPQLRRGMHSMFKATSVSVKGLAWQV